MHDAERHVARRAGAAAAAAAPERGIFAQRQILYLCPGRVRAASQDRRGAGRLGAHNGHAAQRRGLAAYHRHRRTRVHHQHAAPCPRKRAARLLRRDRRAGRTPAAHGPAQQRQAAGGRDPGNRRTEITPLHGGDRRGDHDRPLRAGLFHYRGAAKGGKDICPIEF